MDTEPGPDPAPADAALSAALATIGGEDASRLAGGAPRITGTFEADRDAFADYWRHSDRAIAALPPKPNRNAAQAAAAAAVFAAARTARTHFLTAHVETVYRRLTGNLSHYVRVEDMVFAAASVVPGLVPTRERWTQEMAQKQADKDGVDIDQGLFVSRLMANPALGAHLCHAMLLPRPESLARFADFKRTGHADLGKATVERRGAASIVTMRNPNALNAEDDSTVRPHEIATDLALLDPETTICVLRGGPVPHRKYEGRRVFGAGINLTHLYWGKISYLFYLVRDLGFVNKIYRGLTRPEDPADETLAETTEKLWVAAVEGFAIGGHCQILLATDYNLAAAGAYATLPARKEGIIPGLANLRLTRFTGDRLARQAVMYERRFDCESPEGRLMFDEVVPADGMDAALDRVVAGLANSGVVNAAANRRALRIAQEPMRAVSDYLAVYAREQAYCHTSPALVANLERFWNAAGRTPKP